MKKILILIYLCLCSYGILCAQDARKTVVYDEKQGMNQWHITKMLQDRLGFIWISSWDGLTRFDGYEFVTFKSTPGDESPLENNRVRDIQLAANGDIYCLVDERWFLFSQSKGTFMNISTAENEELMKAKAKIKPRQTKQKKALKSGRKMIDRQGNLWISTPDSIIKTVYYRKPAIPFVLKNKDQARCFFVDQTGTYWVSTLNDKSVSIYNRGNQLLGYLSPSGELSKTYVPFSSSVYVIYQHSDGSIYLGTKPGGLYKLNRQKKGFVVQSISLGNDKANSIYDIKADRAGRLWFATFDGIYCLHQGRVEHVRQTKGWKVRCLHFTQRDILMAATTTGLAVGRLSDKTICDMKLQLHCREPKRVESLGNSATMDILETADHQIYVSTESAGVDKIMSRDLLASQLEFKHFDKTMGLQCETVSAMTPYRKNWIWVVGGYTLMMLNTQTGEVRNYGAGFFHDQYRYSDARPVCLPDGRWLFGLQNGAFCLSESELSKPGTEQRVVFTGISVEHAPMQYAVAHLRSLTLNKHQRNLRISFSTLDFSDTEDLCYAFRLHEGDKWIFIGKEHTVTLPDMQPGDYQLQVRSTNSAGVWTQGIATLRIHVTPKFSETIWAVILYIFLSLATIFTLLYIYLYIRRIKRKQHEVLEAYLALLEDKNEALQAQAEGGEEAERIVSTEEDDQMMKRIMLFIDEHLSDAEIGIVEMAEAAAISRSGLNRKMKKIVGLTPAEFLRETRIKRAQQFLLGTSMSVSEIAYTCGFTDPKYFGKIFRSMTGVSPTDFRQNGGKADK